MRRDEGKEENGSREGEKWQKRGEERKGKAREVNRGKPRKEVER